MKVATRRLLEEQIAVVVVLESGKKDDAMWHVPQLVRGDKSRRLVFGMFKIQKKRNVKLKLLNEIKVHILCMLCTTYLHLDFVFLRLCKV